MPTPGTMAPPLDPEREKQRQAMEQKMRDLLGFAGVAQPQREWWQEHAGDPRYIPVADYALPEPSDRFGRDGVGNITEASITSAELLTVLERKADEADAEALVQREEAEAGPYGELAEAFCSLGGGQ